MIGQALSFPRSGDDWIPTLLIGGVLTVLGVLVIPVFLVQGYFLRVLRAAANGETEAPSFTDWGELLVDGLKLFVVNIAYSLILIIPYFALIFAVGLGGNNGPGALAAVLGLVVFVLALVVGFFIPAAFTNFAIEGDFGAAFDFGTIKDGAFTSDYATAWVLALVVGLVGGLVGAALSFVLVGIFVLFYVQVAVYYMFGRGFAKGLGRTGGGSATTSTL
ncbi:Protein of unknown function [Halogranum gelatinilyticum]|uniref:DUF4013 domain-containing protein n=1 Tax=Halogranum gelatinilyticum TaxID=660521 RepID=A0A1G9SP08_9EURY|nr:DUF4013 domain-containing protein [Halogranum gelatinilyticum]SDM37050.1 Protein of unknown function [Halogranum gelatinilyticum]